MISNYENPIIESKNQKIKKPKKKRQKKKR